MPGDTEEMSPAERDKEKERQADRKRPGRETGR